MHRWQVYQPMSTFFKSLLITGHLKMAMWRLILLIITKKTSLLMLTIQCLPKHMKLLDLVHPLWLHVSLRKSISYCQETPLVLSHSCCMKFWVVFCIFPSNLHLSICSGGSSLHPIWYASPPFRVHHQAKRKMELEWDNEYDSGSSKILKLTITYQPGGRYLIEVTSNIWNSIIFFPFYCAT